LYLHILYHNYHTYITIYSVAISVEWQHFKNAMRTVAMHAIKAALVRALDESAITPLAVNVLLAMPDIMKEVAVTSVILGQLQPLQMQTNVCVSLDTDGTRLIIDAWNSQKSLPQSPTSLNHPQESLPPPNPL
jgi:hypothetical protein